jgi:hypothetical protein
MSAENRKSYSLSSSSKLVLPANYLAEPVRRYLDHHMAFSQEVFLMHALRWEDIYSKQKNKRNGPWKNRLNGPLMMIIPRRPLSDDDIRIHASLFERLAALHRERHGLWAKVRRLFLGK